MRRSSTWLSATALLLLCARMTAPGFRDRSLPMRQARTRPSSRAGEETASARYLGPPKVPPRCNRALPRPPARAEALGYRDDLRPVRGFVASKAKCAGLTPARIPDLVLATSELAANTLRHTGGGGTVQVWRTREEIICQVADTGQIADPLARYRAPSAELLGGHGLWLVNQVCDLVQARTGPAGTTTRLHMRLHRALGRRASRVFKPDEQALRIEWLPLARSAAVLERSQARLPDAARNLSENGEPHAAMRKPPCRWRGPSSSRPGGHDRAGPATLKSG